MKNYPDYQKKLLSIMKNYLHEKQFVNMFKNKIVHKLNVFYYLCTLFCNYNCYRTDVYNEKRFKDITCFGKSPNFYAHTGDSNRNAHVICQYTFVNMYIVQWRGAVAYLCGGCLAIPLKQARQHVPRFFIAC
ncbi:MAG: hypothetical protein LBD59_05925 [Prevotellaceae bacterium]|jgi:hypothetical protein|nr:hypothetical protein [Prevotellaceae bacterium]